MNTIQVKIVSFIIYLLASISTMLNAGISTMLNASIISFFKWTTSKVRFF